MPTYKGITTTDGIDINEVLYNTVLPIIDIYNDEELLDMRALFTHDWDESYRKFDASGKWKFQKLAEGEKPSSVKVLWGKRQRDTMKFGLNIDYTFDWLVSEDASSAEIALKAKKAIERDRALITTTILKVCTENTGHGFYNGSFTANEIMTTPPVYGSNTFTSAHTHYVAAGSTSLALTYITAAKKHLKEHGYKGKIWALANADFISKVEDLAGWYQASTTNVSNVVTDGVAIEGFRGRMLGIDWKETEWMPDGYFLLIGESPGAEKPIMYVQKKKAMGKGLILTPGSYDVKYPLIDATYIHWLESEVVYRGAGVCYYLESTWSDPTDVRTNVVD